MMIAEIDIRLANRPSAMAGLSDALEAFAVEAGAPERVRFNLNLAVEEFVCNAIDHGYPDGRPGEIAVHVASRDGRLEVTLTDDGDAFDPFTAPAPDLAASIDERRIGGLGIHLVRTLADAFAYRREDGRNVVSLTLAFAQASPPQV